MVRLTHEPIDVAALTPAAAADGAVCLFLGVVRDENGGRPVRHLEYEAYEEMARPLMEEIAVEARRRWPVRATQAIQVFLQNRMIAPTLAGTRPLRPPWPARLLNAVPFLRRIPARVLGMGVQPEHVKTKAV